MPSSTKEFRSDYFEEEHSDYEIPEAEQAKKLFNFLTIIRNTKVGSKERYLAVINMLNYLFTRNISIIHRPNFRNIVKEKMVEYRNASKDFKIKSYRDQILFLTFVVEEKYHLLDYE